jgi:predicted dehydrogenase
LDLPDVVHVLTQLPEGARGVYHLSGVALFGPPLQIHLYGSRGTIKVEFGETERVWIGQAGGTQLRPLEIPAAERGGWRVEAEFVGAIRGQEKVRLTDFATGLRYMQFTEAVLRSAEAGAAVSLGNV